MDKNITLENPKINTEEENFYYDRLTGKPFWDLRKMLGRQLFKIRQDYSRSLHRVSQETKIPIKKSTILNWGVMTFNGRKQRHFWIIIRKE